MPTALYAGQRGKLEEERNDLSGSDQIHVIVLASEIQQSRITLSGRELVDIARDFLPARDIREAADECLGNCASLLAYDDQLVGRPFGSARQPTSELFFIPVQRVDQQDASDRWVAQPRYDRVECAAVAGHDDRAARQRDGAGVMHGLQQHRQARPDHPFRNRGGRFRNNEQCVPPRCGELLGQAMLLPCLVRGSEEPVDVDHDARFAGIVTGGDPDVHRPARRRQAAMLATGLEISRWLRCR